MDIYLFDNFKNIIDIIPQGELTHYSQKQELNFLITADIEGEYRANLEDAYYFGSQDVDDRSKFWRYRINDFKKEDGMFSMTGTHEFFDDMKTRKIHEEFKLDNETATSALKKILVGTGWSIGKSLTTTSRTFNIFYETALDSFWHFLTIFNVEFSVRMEFTNGIVTGRFIDLHMPMSREYGRLYEYGNNLVKVVQEQKNTEMFTAVYGRGAGEIASLPEDESGKRAGYKSSHTFADVEWSKAKGDPVDKPLGQEYVEIPEATDAYGHPDGTPRFGVVKFSETTNHEQLLWQTYNYLLNNFRPLVEFEADVFETKLVELGEVVMIMRSDMDIRYKTRVFELERDFLLPERKSIRFGDKLVENRTDQMRRVAEASRVELIEYNTLITHLLNNIEADYYNDMAYTYNLREVNEGGWGLPTGVYSFDAPIDQNPTKVIYFGAGKLLVANSKKPDGTWNWTTMMDGNGLGTGIVGADQIVAHAITSDHIESGSITADHLSAGAITAEMINLSSGVDLQTELNSIVKDKTMITTQFPVPTPYEVGHVWLQPLVDETDVAKYSEKQISEWGLYEEDLVGQRIYKCNVARGAGETFRRSDWELIATGPQAMRDVLDKLQEFSVDITDRYIELRETISSIDSGEWQKAIEEYNHEVTARFAQLDRTLVGVDGKIQENTQRIEAWGTTLTNVNDRIDELAKQPKSLVGWRPPKPPYYIGDQWSSPPLNEKAITWTEKDFVTWGMRETDVIGGRSYVASRDRLTGNFSMSDWIPTGASKESLNELSTLVTQVMAGKISLSSQTKLDGAWQIGSYQIMTPEYTQWGHRDGSYTRASYDGFQRFVSGTGKTYHYMQHQIKVKGWDDTSIRVVLPEDCKGKDFEVTLAPSETGVPYTKSEWNYYLRYGVHKPGAMASAMRRSITRFTITLDPTRAQPIDKANGVVWVKCYKNMHQIDHETGDVTEFMTELNATITVTY